MGLYNFKGLFCTRKIGRTIESRDNGLISGWAYNRDFTVGHFEAKIFSLDLYLA